MKDILKIVKSLENSELLLGVSQTIKNEAKVQKGGFLSYAIRHNSDNSISKYVNRQRSYKGRRRNC